MALPFAGKAATLKDIKIGLHVIDFVINPQPDRTAIGVIYDSRTKESADDAQTIIDALTVGLSRGNSGLKPILIDIRDLDESALLRAAVITDHMKPYFDKLSAYARKTGTLTLSTDLDCVRLSKCTIGIASSPRVEVIFSSQMAQSSGIQFSEAFRMMVTEY